MFLQFSLISKIAGTEQCKMEPTYVSPAQKIMPWVSQQQEGKQGKEFSTMLEKLMAMFSWRKVVDFGTVVYFVII